MQRNHIHAAIVRQRTAERIERNAKFFTDAWGTLYKLTSRRRILAIYSYIDGTWEPARFGDGELRNGAYYVNSATALTPAAKPAQVQA